jgi:hypothetical protein
MCGHKKLWEIHHEAVSLVNHYTTCHPWMQNTHIFSQFQIYDERGSKVCPCQFQDKYSQTLSLNSYFSNGFSCKIPEKNKTPLKYLDSHSIKECKIMGDWVQTPNCFISESEEEKTGT